MVMIKTTVPKPVLTPFLEDIFMTSGRDRLLELIKRTEDCFRNDHYMKQRFPETYCTDAAELNNLINLWRIFRDDCQALPLSHFRILLRLRIHSWTETADEQIVKLLTLTGVPELNSGS